MKAVFKEKTVFICVTLGAIWEIHLRRGRIFSSNFIINSLLGKIIKKTLANNNHKMRALKNSFKKGLKKTCEIEKDTYFCTRIKADVH